jgi:hypothetical protein
MVKVEGGYSMEEVMIEYKKAIKHLLKEIPKENLFHPIGCSQIAG